jgi:peptide/nickel transport system substrate-binding protein
MWVNTFWDKTSLKGSQLTRPTLFAWVLADPYVSGAGRVTFKRNPFYWKVDTTGQQLPYINEVVFAVVDNINAMIPKVLNGEVDMQERHINVAKNKPLFIDYAKRGDYRLFSLYSGSLNRMTIMLNLNHEDPVKREIFNNKAFRIGLSYAINRQEIIDAVLEGAGEPWQTAPSRSSPFYDENMAKQFTEYSLEKANEYLDRAGYPKDTSGMRIGPDGRPISFVVEVTNTQPEWLDMLNMVSTYWTAVGIRMQPALEDRALYQFRKANNQHDAGVWSNSGFLVDVLLDPCYFIQAAEFEPPERVKQAMMIFWSMKDTANVEEQINLARQIVQFAKEEFWTIGIASAYDGYGIVKNNLHNVIDHPAGWKYPNPAPIHPETWYYDPPQK